jgi:hypothetical protein
VGTKYRVFEDKNIKISLYEMSCKFTIDVDLKLPVDLITGDTVDPVDGNSDSSLTVDEMLDLAVSIVGPLHWFDERPETIVDRFIQKLRARHFT